MAHHVAQSIAHSALWGLSGVALAEDTTPDASDSDGLFSVLKWMLSFATTLGVGVYLGRMGSRSFRTPSLVAVQRPLPTAVGSISTTVSLAPSDQPPPPAVPTPAVPEANPEADYPEGAQVVELRPLAPVPADAAVVQPPPADGVEILTSPVVEIRTSDTERLAGLRRRLQKKSTITFILLRDATGQLILFATNGRSATCFGLCHAVMKKMSAAATLVAAGTIGQVEDLESWNLAPTIPTRQRLEGLVEVERAQAEALAAVEAFVDTTLAPRRAALAERSRALACAPRTSTAPRLPVTPLPPQTDEEALAHQLGGRPIHRIRTATDVSALDSTRVRQTTFAVVRTGTGALELRIPYRDSEHDMQMVLKSRGEKIVGGGNLVIDYQHPEGLIWSYDCLSPSFRMMADHLLGLQLWVDPEAGYGCVDRFLRSLTAERGIRLLRVDQVFMPDPRGGRRLPATVHRPPDGGVQVREGVRRRPGRTLPFAVPRGEVGLVEVPRFKVAGLQGALLPVYSVASREAWTDIAGWFDRPSAVDGVSFAFGTVRGYLSIRVARGQVTVADQLVHGTTDWTLMGEITSARTLSGDDVPKVLVQMSELKTNPPKPFAEALASWFEHLQQMAGAVALTVRWRSSRLETREIGCLTA